MERGGARGKREEKRLEAGGWRLEVGGSKNPARARESRRGASARPAGKPTPLVPAAPRQRVVWATHFGTGNRFGCHARKKGSRKDCVPGGQRTAIFSGSDWTFARRPLLGPAAILQSQCFEASVGILANGVRFVVRRKVPRQDSPRADRSTWTIRCLGRYERVRFRSGSCREIRIHPVT